MRQEAPATQRLLDALEELIDEAAKKLPHDEFMDRSRRCLEILDRILDRAIAKAVAK